MKKVLYKSRVLVRHKKLLKYWNILNSSCVHVCTSIYDNNACCYLMLVRQNTCSKTTHIIYVSLDNIKSFPPKNYLTTWKNYVIYIIVATQQVHINVTGFLHKRVCVCQLSLAHSTAANSQKEGFLRCWSYWRFTSVVLCTCVWWSQAFEADVPGTKR